MKATVLKENLKEGLLTVEKAISKSLSLPILGNVLLSCEKNFVELAATDLEIGIRYRMLSKNEQEGSVVIPGRVLSQLVGFLPESSVMLEQRDGELLVVCGDYSTTVKILSAEEFPLIPSLKGEERCMEVEAQSFCRGLNQVAGMAGQSQARPEIGGVYLVFEKDSAKVVATDSFRLGEKTLYFKEPSSLETSFILPQKTAREIISIFSEKEGKVKACLSASQVIFDYSSEDLSQPHVQVVSRLIDGEYPRYQDIIPVIADRAELMNHVRASSIFTGKTNEAHFCFQPEEGGMEITSRNTDVGEHTSFLKGDVAGEHLQVSFNWRFLLEGLGAMKSKDVEMRLSGEDGPAVLAPQEQEGFLYILMPIKA
ncbi:MAG: DNA polymerase III subunit beta [Candidatus Wildermuthbacteria bacterium]|nr:DNA polymerase III subunit beta [Candidatus Wildermuthbacteria bacterium]